MRTEELKGGILTIVAKLEDERVLQEIHALVSHLANETTDPVPLSAYEAQELAIGLEESEDTSNLIAHDEVMKKYAKWLAK